MVTPQEDFPAEQTGSRRTSLQLRALLSPAEHCVSVRVREKEKEQASVHTTTTNNQRHVFDLYFYHRPKY